MWADKSSDVELLDFRVHIDLCVFVVTDSSLLPITVGVFGDWGSGKSSVMKMLEKSLQKNEQIATIYFNGWQFEGYDDAKTALIYSILLELAERKKLLPQIKDQLKGLIKKVNLLKVVNVGLQLATPVIANMLIAQTGTPVILVPSQPLNIPSETRDELLERAADIELDELLRSNPANQALLGARELRKDFSKLIAQTNLQAVVILVDDLDRCEPERLVETLEAIKLFLTVPHVAFVIGADERIVRYAIAKRYETDEVEKDLVSAERKTDLVTDYVEKLIQVPYYLPRLSYSEIETYTSLLFCKQQLSEEQFSVIHETLKSLRTQDITCAFSLKQIQEIADDKNIELPAKLVEDLTWCNTIAPIISDFLKGNPRQTKRLLNALVLRRKLAQVAHLEFLSDQALVKLMLLQYLRPHLCGQLYKWQSSQNGFPGEINDLEKFAKGEVSDMPATVEQGANWNYPSVQRWLAMPPSLSGVDLRSYFWITRDRVEGISSGVSAIPGHMRQILVSLMELEADGLFPAEIKLQIQALSTDDQNILLDELERNLQRTEENGGVIWIWDLLVPVIPSAAER